MADQDSQFEKDFGYLLPFLDKVAAAAGGMANPTTKQELTQLVEGEKERWIRIRQLLSGQISDRSAGSASATKSNAAAQVNSSASESQPERFPQFAFKYTVGSLRKRE